MPKASKPGSQPLRPNTSKKTNLPSTPPTASASVPASPKPAARSTSASKGNQGGKNRRPTIGGTATVGAKSTQPKEIKSTNPQEQQFESYNRDMRRRMQHMGTSPTDAPAMTPREKRIKRLARRKEQRLEEVKKTVAKGPKPNTRLGRKNVYFLIGVVAVLVLVIVLFILIRHPF